MGRILSESDFLGKLIIHYAQRVGYWAGRALIGDVKEQLATGKGVDWRVETVGKRIAGQITASINLGDALSYFVHRKHLESLKKIREEQAETYQQLIKDGVAEKEKSFGYITLPDSQKKYMPWMQRAESSAMRLYCIMSAMRIIRRKLIFQQ